MAFNYLDWKNKAPFLPSSKTILKTKVRSIYLYRPTINNKNSSTEQKLLSIQVVFKRLEFFITPSYYSRIIVVLMNF